MPLAFLHERLGDSLGCTSEHGLPHGDPSQVRTRGIRAPQV